MPTLSSQDQVIATLTLDPKGRPKLLEGKHHPEHTLHCHITERMLMEMNGFVRAKWQNAFHDAARGRDTNPLTSDQSF